MLKSVVVLYRRPDLSPDAFFANLRNEHGPLAERADDGSARTLGSSRVSSNPSTLKNWGTEE